MSKFNIRLKGLRKSRNFSQQSLANALGISKSSINMYERGEREPNFEMLETIADFFNVDMDYLLGKSDVPNRALIDNYQQQKLNKPVVPTRLIPLVGTVACGNPIYAEENIEEYITVSADDKVDFALHAKGDSMNNSKIDDGDIVYVRQQPIVDNGEIALVMVDDSATIKRFYDYGDKIVLRPDSTNPHHKEQVYDKKNYNVLVQGKIIFIKTFVN